MLTDQFLREPGGSSAGSGSVALEGSERLDSLSDEDLLDRFLGSGHDVAAAEGAFRMIVTRHGPMVLGVCRHVLNQQQDAEDAFQATFLVLARKAVSIRDRRVLARWLYEVSYRIALRARSERVRRRGHERQGGEMAATICSEHSGSHELRPILHDEVSRLPEKYRLPVILCYLEGKTNEEVARILDWPVGTVKGRLSRARDLLRSRLTRRGLALSAVLLFNALEDGTVFADMVPTALIDETVGNALAVNAVQALSMREELESSADSTTHLAPEIQHMMDLAFEELQNRKRQVFAVWLAWLLSVGLVVGVLVVSVFVSGANARFGGRVGWPFDGLGLGPTSRPVPAALAVPAPVPAPASCH